MKLPQGGGSRRASHVTTWLFGFVLCASALSAVSGCKEKVSQAQCEQLLDHFAELVVKERYADAGPDTVAAERTRERQEAKNADEFRNCTTAVQTKEHECAMKAQTSDALIKCLE